jgi:hypothetical protein
MSSPQQPDPDETNGDALLEGLESLRNLAAMATGVRADLIKEGWSPEGAEQIAITLFRKAMSG